jgi:uncharacterized protein (UPF0333 family)
MRNTQKGSVGKTFLLVVIIVLVGASIWFANNKSGAPKKEAPLQITWTEVQIQIGDRGTLSINDFPDDIKVSSTTSFGSSDRIKSAKVSPDNKWLAISVGGAAHDFGWIYEVATKKLTPVIFSYGGGVEVGEWNSHEEVVFKVSTPKPETIEKVINVNALPEYPM